MTNLQLWLGVSIPSLLVVLSWMQTSNRLSDLKGNMNHRFTQVESRLTRLKGDYRDFYGMEKQLEGRVDELSRR